MHRPCSQQRVALSEWGSGLGRGCPGCRVKVVPWPQRCSLASPGTLVSLEKVVDGIPSGRGQRHFWELAGGEGWREPWGAVGVPLLMGMAVGVLVGDYSHELGGIGLEIDTRLIAASPDVFHLFWFFKT